MKLVNGFWEEDKVQTIKEIIDEICTEFKLFYITTVNKEFVVFKDANENMTVISCSKLRTYISEYRERQRMLDIYY